MFETINRNAIIISPKQPLIDWVNAIYPDEVKMEIKSGSHDESNVYLIPEMEDIEESLTYLEQNYERYLEFELFEWTQDEALWPKKLSWKLFNEWFCISIQTMIFDDGLDKIIKEEF